MKSDVKNKIQTIIDRFDAPFFFYDLDLLREHLTEMRKELDPDIKLWYACKANPMSAVLKIMRNLDFGIDVASSGELHQVLNTGIDPSKVLATGPGKSKKYIKHLITSGVETIVLESLNQAYWANEIAVELDRKVNCLLRVQLDWNEGKSVLGGDDTTPFGINSNEWLKLDKKKVKNLNIRGYHVFQWGNIMDIKRLEKIWRKTVEEVQDLSKKLGYKVQVMDLGGGLGIPYNFTETPLNFSEVKGVLNKIKKDYSLNEIWMELGRFAVGECGYYLTKIIDTKEVRGRSLLVCDGGINHIARVALVKQAFPAKALKSNKVSKKYHIHGSLCTALDHLGEFEMPENMEIGDWLVFHKTGAYGFTESMPFFLCHMLPGEVVYYNGDLMIPRPPKTSYDWMI